MLSFANAVGNLFNRIGSCGGRIKNVYTYQQSLLSGITNVSTGLVAQYNSEPDLQAVFGGPYLGFLSSVEGASRTAQRLARLTLNRMIYRDSPQPGQTLTQGSPSANLQVLINQMKATGASVLAMTIAATPQYGSYAGIGNGIVVTSVKRPYDGLVLENSFSETLQIVCTADSYTGGQTAGNEQFAILGVGQVTDPFAFNWPGGSGGNAGTNAIDGSVSNGSNNLLTNSDFESWSGGLPVGWTSPLGASLFTQGSTVYTGSSSLKITGDGATQAKIQQLFGGGTPATLAPLSQYSFNVFARNDGTVAGAGVITVDFVDQNGVQIRDAAGNINQFTFNASALNTTFAAFNGAFRTPAVLPTSIYMRIWQSTPITNGRSIYLDKASLGLMTQAYTSGIFAAVHAGSTPFQINDNFPVLVSNNRGAAGTLSTFQTLYSQIWPEIISQEFLLPSSASPTISDALIQ